MLRSNSAASGLARWKICAGVLTLGLAVIAMPAVAQAGGATRGYVVTWFGQANNQGKDDCPEGPAVKPNPDEIVAKLPPAERERVMNDIRSRISLTVGRGPNRENVCEHPDLAVEPPLRTVQGKIAYGVDLDGAGSGQRTAISCPHENFVGLDGSKGVDNQYYRVEGCMFGFREDGVGGYIEKYFNSVMRDGNWTMLIELTGVDDIKNDDDVSVGIYKGADPMVRDAVGTNILSGASLQIDENPHYQHRVRGKIVNGVLTTDSVDIFVEPSKNYIKPEMRFRGGRLKLELLPDGTAKGVLAGYLNWKHMYNARSRAGGEQAIGKTCPAEYQALKSMADGYPDPQTGECTAISAAYLIEAIPAFVIHTKERTTTLKEEGDKKRSVAQASR